MGVCRQEESFRKLWNGLGDSINKLGLVAVSKKFVHKQCLVVNIMRSRTQLNCLFCAGKLT